ncbi:MAG: glycosyltransferase family 2 protein, partial [Planctomycetota bacterium]
MQALEYFMSIGLRKRFLNLFGMNVQASGAFGAFRRQALLECGAWDAEIAEDADISLKMKRAGWKISFAPEAVALTSVPPTLRQLNNQRNHWDRGILRNYYHKHGDLLKFWQYDWRNATEMALEYFFSFFLTLFYAAYLVAMLVYDPRLLLFAFAVCYLMNVVFAFIQAGAAIYLSERRAEEWRLLDVVVLWPLYKAWYRVLRFKCIVLEMLRINYEIAYLPASAWRNAPRW